MSRRRWTAAEDEILEQHHLSGSKAVIAALAEHGFTRNQNQVWARSQVLGLSDEVPRSLLGSVHGDNSGGLMAPMVWPARPQRITSQLAELAESNPSPQRYARERARILANQ